MWYCYFAAVCILGFAWFVYYLVTQQNAEDKQWTRLTYLFNGVEAITFTAAGYLFGREVNRRRAETAEARAEQAENKAAESNAEKIKLQTTQRTWIICSSKRQPTWAGLGPGVQTPPCNFPARMWKNCNP